jgi:hypothetical protein
LNVAGQVVQPCLIFVTQGRLRFPGRE